MEKKVSVEISARHVHLSEEVYKKLFGEDAEMTSVKDLTGGGAFVDARRVTLVGPKSEMTRVAILGPYRPVQIELSKTDARKLGIVPPVRESGDVKGSPGCKLVGPEGEIEIESGVIVAKRHIHLTPQNAEDMGLKDKQIVSVKVGEPGARETTFGDVIVRVSEKYAPAMHIDTDEANAAGVAGNVEGEIIV